MPETRCVWLSVFHSSPQIDDRSEHHYRSSSPTLRFLNFYPKSRENRKGKGMIRSPFYPESSSPSYHFLNSYPKSKSRENRKGKGMTRSPFLLKISVKFSGFLPCKQKLGESERKRDDTEPIFVEDFKSAVRNWNGESIVCYGFVDFFCTH